MAGCLSGCYIGHEGVITELSMSWIGKEGQQLDKTYFAAGDNFAHSGPNPFLNPILA
jgi:hypothetical protein